MAPAIDDEDEKPLDPAVERVRRRVLRFMAINMGVLFVALMAVAVAIVYRLGTDDDAPAEEARTGETIAAQGTIALPAGARIVSQSLSGDRMVVQIALPDGARAFLVYDLVSGSVVSRVAVEGGE